MGISAAASLPEQIEAKKPLIINESHVSLTRLDLREIWAFRELLYFLTWRDIKVRYKQTAMGAAWAIIQPVFMMLTFAVFFGFFIGIPTDGIAYMLFFYCGLMPWIFFSGAITQSNGSLINSSNLITKVYFPRIIIPAASIGSLLIDLLITIAILFAVGLYFGMQFSWHLAMLPVFIVMVILLAFAFGLLLAALTVKYRDVRHALPFVLQIWMFVTPIVYPLSVVHEKYHWLMYLNPLTGIVEGIRSSMVAHPFNVTALIFSTVILVITMIAAIYTFRTIEQSIADLI
jgi:lipopolysaccharide transport system permease protein